MLNAVADVLAENIKGDLTNDEEEDAEQNVTQWPTVLQRSNHKDDLADGIDEEKDGVDNVSNHKDSDRVTGRESPVLEGKERNCTTNEEHAKGAEA